MLMLIIGVVVVVAAVAVGIWLGNLGYRRTPERDDRPSVSADCESACSLFQARQQEACAAERAASAADIHAGNMRSAAIAVGIATLGPAATVIAAIITASISATVASGGTLAPATVGVIVLAVAVAALAVLILFPVILALITAAVTAAVIAANKRQEALDAAAARGEARQGVIDNCSTEEADACLSLPFEC